VSRSHGRTWTLLRPADYRLKQLSAELCGAVHTLAAIRLPSGYWDTTSTERRTNLIWLPFWLASANPAAYNRRLISRKGRGLSRPNLNLNCPNFRRACRPRRLEMKLQRLLQICESLLFAVTLAGDIHFKTLRDIPMPFAPDTRRERALHRNPLLHHRFSRDALHGERLERIADLHVIEVHQ
jgi:hypothetical protein